MLQGQKNLEKCKGDVYTGTDTVEYLATGVADRVFFATNKSTLTTAARDTIKKTSCLYEKEKRSYFYN